MKRRLLLSLLALALSVLVPFALSGCSGAPNQDSAVQRAFHSAIAPNAPESDSLSAQDALTLVNEKLDPQENYTASVSPAPVPIDSNSYYIVTISQDGQALEPAAAVDPVTGDLYCCYEGKTIADFSDFPFVAQNQKLTDWNGEYQNADNSARVTLTQSDSQSFDFTLEASVSGITTRLCGIANIQGNLAQYEGEDGMCLVFLLNDGLLTIHVPSNNTASGAGGFAGEYTLTT